MRKSTDITKYDLDWQIVRVSLKGNRFSIPRKLDIAYKFFLKHSTIDNKERIINWLEGMKISVSDVINNSLINDAIDLYKSITVADRGHCNNNFNKYGYKSRYALWKDLYIRNKKWLSGGYYNEELNVFMDDLYNSFPSHEYISNSYSYSNLINLRSKSKRINNTYKFLY